MAEQKKVFSSIIDQFLDDRSPNWEELDLEGAVDSGEQQLDRTHKYVDEDFEDAIGESATSHHTPIWGPRSASSPSREQQNREQRLATARAQAQEKASAKAAREGNGSMGGPTTSVRTAGTEIDFVNEIADDASVMKEKCYKINRAPGIAELPQKSVTDAKVQKYIETLLSQGHAPAKVAAVLFKLAEGQPFYNKQMSQEYLNQMTGLLGFNNLEPNHYMPKTPETYQRMQTKVGEWQGELKSSLNRMTAGVPKTAKQSALTRICQRELERKIASKQREKTAASQTGGQIVLLDQVTRSSSIAAVQDKHNRKVAAKEKQIEVTAGTVEALHKKGHSIEKIYNAAARKVGSVQAGAAVKTFIANLKRNGTKVALSQIDCSFLKQKLGVQNAIVGASKCASCVYRQGMHCGLTGGTLLSFPGMERQASNHKIAEGAPKDGHAMLAEFEMNTGFPMNAGDIDIKEPERLDVQLGSSFSLGDFE